MLLPATPGRVSLPVVVGVPRHSWLRVPGAVPRHSWLGSAGGGGVWCAAVVCWWGCGWCVVWLVPRHSWRRFLCATPRHSWLGFAAGGGARSSPLLAIGCLAVTFVRCPSRVRGVTCNILVFFPHSLSVSPLCSVRGCNILISPTFLRVPCVTAALCSLFRVR